MRKLFYTSILTILASVTGCTEVITVEKEFEPVDNTGYTLIEADLETLLIENEDRLWPEDAYIGVYGSEQGENERYTIKDAGAGLKSATFYGPLVKGNIAAYYPYDPTYIGNADGMPVVLESEQEFFEDNSMLTQFLTYTPRAYGYMQNGKIGFVYPNGVLHITIETIETLNINSITISSASSKIAGLGIVRDGGVTELTDTATDTVTLSCGEGVLSRNGDGFTDFYMVLVPGTYEDLEISLGIVGEKSFVRSLPPMEIKRVSADEFVVASVAIKPTGGPADFIDTPVEFE